MKINIKPKAEPTVQRKLRLPSSLNEQMNDTGALADELKVDYHATLVAALEQFNTEFDARLREMKAKGERPTASGLSAGTISGLIAEADSSTTVEAAAVPVATEQHSPTIDSIANTSAPKSAASSPPDLTSLNSSTPGSNGLQKDQS